MEGQPERSQGIWNAKRQVTQIHIKENSKLIWPFAHILMNTGLRVKSAYIREKGIKSHVQQIIGVFRDDLGNIKGTIMAHGVQRVCKGTGKSIKVWSTLCGKISCNTYEPSFQPTVHSFIQPCMSLVWDPIWATGLAGWSPTWRWVQLREEKWSSSLWSRLRSLKRGSSSIVG